MFEKLKNILVQIALILMLISKPAYSQVIQKIEISGNERISDNTILMFAEVNIGQNIKDNDLNNILKKLYNSNFFKNVSVQFKKNILSLIVEENPIIDEIIYNGIKSKTLKEKITSNLKLIKRSSYNEVFLKKDKNLITSNLKDQGYYFSEIDIKIKEKAGNRIDIIYDISLGDKAKIKKISFIGNKIFKDGKLRSIIISEEFKFWKFISGKKYLNESIINFDKKLLKNFYLNKGYFDVDINSSFAKLIDSNEFELIFNIEANEKFYFDNLTLDLPTDFEMSNFESLNKTFQKLKNQPYSINAVKDILSELDQIAIDEQFETIKSTVIENINLNKINLTFKIEETEKFFVEKINIFGNNITRENVIRNQFLLDEGDPYNEILANKTVNEIKSLNFFRNVSSEILEGDMEKTKIINITVEEKPTGEIMAGAGFGTSGELIEFGIKENNYLGKGLAVETNLSLSTDKVTGLFNVKNPNFNNSDKSINFGLLANETDKLSSFGYKSKKVGTSIGTDFEYLKNFRLGLETSTYIEDITIDSSASARQKKQEGSYFDTYLKFNFNYDKRNQKYKPSDGFISLYSLDLPVVSDKNTITNYYNYKIFSELYENNVSSFSLSLSSANSLTGEEIKSSERLYIPQRKLRGFVNGKVGPKDGDDFIGGNYYAIMNLSSTLPQILPNSQNLDIGTFLDIANIWGVDDDVLEDGSELRSSIGIGVDWFTPVGPLSFSFAHPITKNSSDKTETFRFNLGTTF